MPTRQERLQKIEERLQKEKEKEKQLKAQKRKLEAKEREKKRKEQTRQKVIIGGLMLNKALQNEAEKKKLVDLLEEVTRKQDKAAIAPLLDKLKNNKVENIEL